MAHTTAVVSSRPVVFGPRWIFPLLLVCLAQTFLTASSAPAQNASSRYEEYGTLKKTDAAHPFGQQFVLTDDRGTITSIVETVPGIDLARYVERQVVIHGSQKSRSGPNGVPIFHPWRIDVATRPFDFHIVDNAGPADMARAHSVSDSNMGTPSAVPPAIRALFTTLGEDPRAPQDRGRVAQASHAVPAASSTVVTKAAPLPAPQQAEEVWAVPPPEPYQGGTVMMDPDSSNYSNYSSCDQCGQGGMGYAPPARRNEPSAQWSAAFEATFLEPRFNSNPALTVMESDGVAFESFTVRDFEYDMSFAPRIWAAYTACDGGGLRAQYWRFDQSALPQTASPPANGFGSVSLPVFAGIGISTTIPSDVVATSSSIDAYVIDLEATQRLTMKNWRADFTFGVRYGSIEQTYGATLRDGAGVLVDQIDFDHKFQGAGPTMSLSVFRQIFGGFDVFGIARGSLLYGDGKSNLRIGEDLDLTNPFTTTQVTNSSDLLPIGEMQVGVSYTCSRWEIFQPFVRAALEGQVWHGAGSATSLDGDLGFVGFSGAAGVNF